MIYWKYWSINSICMWQYDAVYYQMPIPREHQQYVRRWTCLYHAAYNCLIGHLILGLCGIDRELTYKKIANYYLIIIFPMMSFVSLIRQGTCIPLQRTCSHNASDTNPTHRVLDVYYLMWWLHGWLHKLWLSCPSNKLKISQWRS